MRTIAALSATLLMQGIVVPQSRNEAGRPFVENYLPKDYRAHPQNWDVEQDHRGILYFANSLGIVEYDGVTWRLIPGPNKSVVRSFALHRQLQRLYVGGNADFGYLAPNGVGQMEFASLLEFVDEAYRQFGNIWQIEILDYEVYFQGYNHLFRYAPVDSGGAVHVFKVWKASGRFTFAAQANGKLYVHDAHSGLTKIEDDSLRLLPGGDRFADVEIAAILPFSSDAILIAAADGSLFIFDGNEFKLFESEAATFLRDNQLMSGAASPDGNFAFSTMRGGVLLMNTSGDILQILDQTAGLLDNFVRRVYFDRHGAMWLALDGGLARAETPSPLSVYDDKTGLDSYVVSIARHDGTLYVATGLGVYYLDTIRRQFRVVSGITARSWWLLPVDDQLLVATDDGVYRVVANKALAVMKSVGQSFYTYSLFRSRRNPNRVFAGLLDGLAILRLDRGRWIEEWRVNGLNQAIRNFAETDDGKLWMGTHSTGLLRMDIAAFSGDQPPEMEKFGAEHGLPQGGVSVFRVGDDIVFAMRDRLLRFDEDKKTFTTDSTFAFVAFGGSTEEYTLKQDLAGNIWVNFGVETALVSRRPDGSAEIQKKPFREISDLPNYFVYPEDDGVVWFGSEEVLIRYDPHVGKEYNLDYDALIRQVVVGGDSVIYGGGPILTAGEPAQLDYGQNAIRLEFSASSFEAVKENQYQTFLESFDQGWSAWTKEPRRDYTNLPPGDYRFRVKAKNIYQHESSEAVYVFSILSPWYWTWWAFGLYGFVGLCLLFGLVRIRTNQLRERSRELEKTVAERTAELQQRVEELAVINSVQDGLVRELDIQAIYNLVGDQIRDIFDAQVVMIATFDHQKGNEHFHYVLEKGERFYPEPRPLDNVRRYLINTKEIWVVNEKVFEVMRSQGAKVIPGTEVPRSVLFVPLIVGSTVRGYVNLQNIDREHAFSDSDVRLLSTLSNSMSVALENARLFDETARLLAETEQHAAEMATVNGISKALVAQLEFDTLIHLVGEKMLETFKADIVYVAVLNKETNMIDFPYEHGDNLESIPYGEGLTSRIILTGEPLLVNRDLKRVHEEMGIETIGVPAASYLGVPIPAGDENIGVISVQSTTEENRFNEDSLRLLSTIAANVGVAMQNADSYRKLNDALENLKSTQDQLVTQEKLASLGALTAGIAHEIKNPLNFVNNFAELSVELVHELRGELEKNATKVSTEDAEIIRDLLADLEQNAQKINEHGRRADSIVKSMLQHSRGRKGERQHTDVNALLDEDINLAYHGRRAQDSSFNINVEKMFAEDLPGVSLVPQDISRVFLNLIANGFYAAHQKKLKMGKDFSPTLWVTTETNGDVLRIRIRDNGDGVPPEIQDKLFNPFFTTKPTGQGTGLGLSISYDIVVQEHGGDLRFDSKAGEFTEFVVELPLQ
jgi:signal transduction histidine kinase